MVLVLLLYRPAENIGKLGVLRERGGSTGSAPNVFITRHPSGRRKRTVVSAALHTCLCLVPENQSFKECFKECLVLERDTLREDFQR